LRSATGTTSQRPSQPRWQGLWSTPSSQRRAAWRTPMPRGGATVPC